MSTTPRESSEWRGVEVKASGQILTSGVEVCVTARGVRPTEATWKSATMRDGKTCVRVADLTPGYWWAFGRGTVGDEVGVVGPFEFLIG